MDRISKPTSVRLLENPGALKLPWKSTLDSARQSMSLKLAKLRDLEHEVRKKHMAVQHLAGPNYTNDSMIIVGVCAMEKKSGCKPMRVFSFYFLHFPGRRAN